MATQNIVQHGHRWQVGNRQTIDIWHNKWLTTPSTFRLISRPQAVPDGAKVLVLIDPHTRSWQTNTIHQYFSLANALAILSILISSWLPSDRMVWVYTTKGRGVCGAVRCGAVLGHFQHRTLRCSLTKTITASHLVFALTCAVQCGLEFSQNHNRIAPHFCSYMCDTMYKMRFKVGIFFKFWPFPTQPKTNFSIFLGQILNY